jgi:hypothetical protein
VTGPEARSAGRATQIELRIVESGIRRDQGLPDAGVVALQIPELTEKRGRAGRARLFYAYADALLDADREEEARDWFGKAAAADSAGETDAAERLDELDEVLIDDLDDDDEDNEAGADEGEFEAELADEVTDEDDLEDDGDADVAAAGEASLPGEAGDDGDLADLDGDEAGPEAASDVTDEAVAAGQVDGAAEPPVAEAETDTAEPSPVAGDSPEDAGASPEQAAPAEAGQPEAAADSPASEPGEPAIAASAAEDD